MLNDLKNKAVTVGYWSENGGYQRSIRVSRSSDHNSCPNPVIGHSQEIPLSKERQSTEQLYNMVLSELYQ